MIMKKFSLMGAVFNKLIVFLIIPLILSIGIVPALMIDDVFAKTSRQLPDVELVK